MWFQHGALPVAVHLLHGVRGGDDATDSRAAGLYRRTGIHHETQGPQHPLSTAVRGPPDIVDDEENDVSQPKIAHEPTAKRLRLDCVLPCVSMRKQRQTNPQWRTS